MNDQDTPISDLYQIHFDKYHSLSNDFILLDAVQPSLWFNAIDFHSDAWRSYVRRLCARHVGIGADGVLILSQPSSSQTLQVHVYNADGSSTLTCLNGLAVVAHHCATRHGVHNPLTISMGHRLYTCHVADTCDHDAQARLVNTSLAPVHIEQDLVLTIDQERFEGTCVSVGNPHYICFRSIGMDFLRCFGPKLEHHPAFPDRTNVEFVWHDAHDPLRFHVLVHERGCGITQACSSGAAAILGLLHAREMVPSDTPVVIEMSGGHLTGQVHRDTMTLQSQSHHIFSGVFLRR